MGVYQYPKCKVITQNRIPQSELVIRIPSSLMEIDSEIELHDQMKALTLS